MTPSATDAMPVRSSGRGSAGSQQGDRVVSVDALRGFDMFWIIGGEGVVHALAKIEHAEGLKVAAKQLSHKDWDGFGFYDLIFPLFVFIVGVSLVFSLSKLLSGSNKGLAVRRIVLRSLALFALGILYNGGLAKQYHDIRLMGVLQRIALCYLAAGLLFCFFQPRVLAGIAVGLLVGYWALLSFVPAPGRSHVSFEEGKNLTNYVDAHYLPWRKYDGNHDPEGILSTFPAIATCLLGVFAGLLLRNGSVGPYYKVLYLLLAGGISVALGTIWGHQFPIIKKIWTSSFVLVAGGYSALLLGVFYLLIDVWKQSWWAKPFLWIGTNAITMYMLSNLFDFRGLAERFIGGEFERRVLGPYGHLAIDILAVLFLLVLARFLYTRKIFLRV